MKRATLPYHFSPPPHRLKTARLDNIALVPASLLPFKHTYQQLANALPQGSILCVQSRSARHKRILERVAAFLKTHSRQVLTLPVERIKKTSQPTKPAEAHKLTFAF